jgi:hypothetical protein
MVLTNNGECSTMVVPLVVIQESAGSTPVIHPKQCTGSSGVEQLVEAQRVGGSNPSRCTKFNM